MITGIDLFSYCGVIVGLGLTLSALVAVPASVRAEGIEAASFAHRPIVRSKRSRVDAQVEALAKSLELTGQQKSAIRNILEQRQQEIMQARLAPSTSESSATDRFLTVEYETVDRIRAALNVEQRKKYDPIGHRSTSSAAEQATVEEWINVLRPAAKNDSHGSVETVSK